MAGVSKRNSAMKESIGNIRMVCPEHSPLAGRYADLDPQTLVGHFVKKAFNIDDPKQLKRELEHMWILVKRVTKDGKLEGELDNDPLYVSYVKCGDIVQLTTAEVEEVLAAD